MFGIIIVTVAVVLYVEAMIYFYIKYSKEELYGEKKDTKPEMVNGVEKKYVCYRENCNSRCCFKQATSTADVTYEFDDHSVSPIFRNPNEKTTTVTYSKQVIPALETEEKYKETENETNEGLC